MNLDQLGWLLAAAFLVFMVVSWARRWWAARAWDREHRRRLETASRGEDRSFEILESAGFEILASQVTHEYELLVDGEPLVILLRCDHIVQRDGVVYVAEVKTGENAPDLGRSATRRQLLEYLIAYDVEGVLLVDMHRDQIRNVNFPITSFE